VPLLASPDAEIRQHVAYALGMIRDKAATDALIGTLKDSDPVVRGYAATALGEIGDVDPFAVMEHGEAFHQMFELAHVAGPAVHLEPVDGLGREAAERGLGIAVAQHEMVDQQRHVDRPLAERRQRE
jgi:hypothetical protein